MENIAAKLKDRNGAIALKLGFIMVILSIIIFTFITVARIYFIFDAAKERANEAVLAVAAYNIAEFYGGAREGDGYARHALGGNTFGSAVTTEDVLAQMAVSLDAEPLDDNTLYKEGNYYIRNLNVRYVNTVDGNLNFLTTFTVIIQLSIAGSQIDGIEKDIQVNTTYAPKF